MISEKEPLRIQKLISVFSCLCVIYTFDENMFKLRMLLIKLHFILNILESKI